MVMCVDYQIYKFNSIQKYFIQDLLNVNLESLYK